MRLSFVGILSVAAISWRCFFPFSTLMPALACFGTLTAKAMLVARNMDLNLDDHPVFYVFPTGISKNGGSMTSIQLSGLPSTAAS